MLVNFHLGNEFLWSMDFIEKKIMVFHTLILILYLPPKLISILFSLYFSPGNPFP